MRLLAFLLSTTLFGVLVTIAPAEPLNWSPGGFQIEPLTTTGEFAAGQLLTMSISPKDGFATNVNVMAQPFNGTLDEYMAITRKQFADNNTKLVEERRVNATEWVTEYAGTYSGRNLHWYARVILARGKAILATATTLETQWPTVSAELKKCIDSLKITP
jgi:hypothetical protein